jgi:tetratricopeptide (TPR) repeat protein
VPDPREYDADIALLAQVRGAGEASHLRVQLRRPGAPRAEWSKDYAIAFKDLSLTVATMQNDIAQHVLLDRGAAALFGQLTTLETNESLRAANRAYEGGTRVEDWNDAIVHFEQALRRDPDNPRAWCRLSRVYMQWIWTGQKSVEEALAKALPAIERGEKEHPALDDCLAAQAEVAVVQGKMEEGRALLQRLLEVNPNDSEALEGIASYAILDGEIARGTQGYERLVREHPDGVYTWFRLVVARGMMGDEAGARAGLRVMHDAWPELAITHHAFGLHAEIANDHAAAVRHQESAAAADPTNAAFGWAAAMEATEILALDRAQAVLDRMGATENRNYVVPRMWLFIARNEPARAVEWYRAQHLPPSVLDTTHGALGLALAWAGDRKGALAEFRLGEAVRLRNRQPLNAPFPHSLRIMFPENFAALLPPGSRERHALVRQLIERDALYRREGGNYALLDYSEATHAALEGRIDVAFRQLDLAIAHGFSGAFSLRRDLAWMDLRDDPRLKLRLERLDAIAAAQRKSLREGGRE